MSADCKYSIIICTRNRAPVLERALGWHADLERKLRLGCAYISCEYIIVDNGSRDNTHQVVEKFSGKVTSPVKYIFEQRAGHSIALNSGCKCAAGKRLVFTDDDTLPSETWINAIHNAFESNAADWVYGPVHPKWEFGPAPKWYGRKTCLFIACLDLGASVLVDDQLTSSFVGANHACDKDLLFELGLYDEELGLRGDGLSYAGNDDNLFHKARDAGRKIVYTPAASVEHLIAENRYDRKTHLRNFWRTGINEYRVLRTSRQYSKSWYGVPRWYYRHLTSHFTQFVSALVRRDPVVSFYHQTQVWRFSAIALSSWGLLQHASGGASNLESKPVSKSSLQDKCY